MGTRATIGLVKGNQVEYIGLCKNGYPEHAGEILKEHYNTLDKIQQLLDMGELSVLGIDIGRKHNFYEYLGDSQCTFFIRDRNETSDKFKSRTISLSNWNRECTHDYNYIFNDGVWRCRDRGVTNFIARDNAFTAGYHFALATEGIRPKTWCTASPLMGKCLFSKIGIITSIIS